MTLKIRFFILISSITTLCNSQTQSEIAPPENIKSIVFTSTEYTQQFPLIKLGESLQLSFDDLYADEEDYYYKIEHCNYDWTPSRIMKSEYLNGLDDQRITTYSNSLATLQPYTHYSLTLPNNITKFKVSGNYILKIFDGFGKLIFSRKFIIYTDTVQVGVIARRTRDFNYINSSQRLEFSINSGDFELINPQNEVKITMLQNENFNTAINNIKPQFISGSSLLYKYDMETAYEGGNEYFNFDSKDLRTSNNSIAHVELKNRYNHYLYTNEIRKNKVYTYFPDINGNYQVRILEGLQNDVNNEADYTFVRFSLETNPDFPLQDIYVYGKFNNYVLGEENKLKFNEKTNKMETAILLKQGFYNYKFVMADKNNKLLPNAISGSHWETENEYLIIVYYRKFGELYDSVIGIGSCSSQNISN